MKITFRKGENRFWRNLISDCKFLAGSSNPSPVHCCFITKRNDSFIKFPNYLTRNKLSPDTMNVIQSAFPVESHPLDVVAVVSFEFETENELKIISPFKTIFTDKVRSDSCRYT